MEVTGTMNGSQYVGYWQIVLAVEGLMTWVLYVESVLGRIGHLSLCFLMHLLGIFRC